MVFGTYAEAALYLACRGKWWREHHRIIQAHKHGYKVGWMLQFSERRIK